MTEIKIDLSDRELDIVDIIRRIQYTDSVSWKNSKTITREFIVGQIVQKYLRKFVDSVDKCE